MSVAYIPPGGPSASSDTLTLGSVAFLDEEHPNDLSIELQRAWAIITYIGGSRIAQDLGPKPDPITWTGQLFAGEVAPRLAALAQMYKAAQKIPLTYLNYSFNVVITKFTPKMLHRWRAFYTVTVEIIDDTSGIYQSPTNTPNPEQQVDSISASAQSLLVQLVQQDSVGSGPVNSAFNALFAELELDGLFGGIFGSL